MQKSEILINGCNCIYANRFLTTIDGNVGLRLENGNMLTDRILTKNETMKRNFTR